MAATEGINLSEATETQKDKYSVPQLGASFEILDTRKLRVVKKVVNGRRRVSGLRLLRRGG